MAYSQVKTQHPCADAKLGAYSHSETLESTSRPKKFVTVFWYDRGAVLMDNDWKWHTIPTQGVDIIGNVEAAEAKVKQLLGEAA